MTAQADWRSYGRFMSQIHRRSSALKHSPRTATRCSSTPVLTHGWAEPEECTTGGTSAQIVKRLGDDTEIVLAGGLRPRNVGEAIAQVRPLGVDVNSGVED